MRSKRDLATRVLRDLTVTSLADEMAPEDAERAFAGVDEALEYLVDENVIVFNYKADKDSEVIPLNHFTGLTMVVRFFTAPVFGKEASPAVLDFGLKMLRRSVMQGTSDVPVEADYF